MKKRYYQKNEKLAIQKFNIWLKAFRLRTLPLALANAVMGSFLAMAEGAFKWEVFILTVFTITFLQILSNLANDYGDGVSGKDTANRLGPQRVTVSGLVSRSEMKWMISMFILLSLASGTTLIVYALQDVPLKSILLFFALGLAAIVAAIKYTVGKNPYGYKGLGDIYVFVFFGLVGVIGTYYMHTNWFDVHVVIPAMIIGLFSTAVLNINNLRDIASDTETGKKTLAVQFGLNFARTYHLVLIFSAWAFALIYTMFYYNSHWQWMFLLTLPLFIINSKRVYFHRSASELNNELKNLAFSSFLSVSYTHLTLPTKRIV